MAAMVSMSSLINGKDSRWLQLEVCREFQRNKCSRPDTECKFAHPPANVEVQNGRVTACYDSIKGRCNREKPPCKYFHPPQHLKDQLLINGRNHLALKNALMQQIGMAPPTPTPSIISSPLQPMTANRYMPASNPYNPYICSPGMLPTLIGGPEHASLGGQMQQAVPMSSNVAAQSQKLQRTDRIQNASTTLPTTSTTSGGNLITNSTLSSISTQLPSSSSLLANFVDSGTKRNADCLQVMDQMKFMGPYYEQFAHYPGMMPAFKRPAPDKPAGIPVYQQSAAAYQQLMQMQHQPYIPVSSQQNSINQSSPSKAVTPSNIIENNMLTKNAVVATAPAAAAPDGDSENANLTVQNAKINANGTDGLSVSAVAGDDSDDQNFSKSIDDVPNGNDLSSLQNDNHHHQGVDDATQTSSVQSTIDKNNLNAISFNSATSSSPAASLSASTYTTSSISNNNNNNNSILSRKNSLSMSNQLLISNSKAPTSVTNTPSSKVDSLPDLITASALNNSQAALLSAVLYNQNPYQQYAIAPNIYSDPAQMAKDMAQKNYANALKYAVAAQNTQAAAAAAAKSSLTALPYTGVALPGSNTAMYAQQQAGTSANPRLPNPMTQQARSPYMSALSRPLQNPFQQYIRPQMAPVNMTAATHPYYAAAAAHQQFLSQQQNLFYSGLTNPMAGQQLTATSGASTAPTQFTSNTYSSAYPFGLSQSQAMNAQGLPASMMQVPQMTAPSQQSQTGSTSAVVLNPYKKMKTS